MEVHVTSSSEFQSDVSIEHGLTGVVISNHLNNSVILQSSYSSILIPTLDRFCRVCGNEMEPKELVPIFTDKGLQLDIPKKISAHLQIHVVQDDALPQQVCFSCIYQLNICQQLVQVSQEADIKLHEIFQTVKPSRDDSIHILSDHSFQPIQHEILKDSCTDDLVMQTASDIKIVLMQSVQEEEQSQPVKTCSQRSAETLDDNSTQPLKYKTLKDSSGTLQENDKQGNHQDLDKEVADKTTEDDEGSDRNIADKKQDKFLCDLCGKHFQQAANLRTHKRTHLSDSLKKKHMCNLCAKSFRSKFFLSEHMNMHKGVRPYGCSDCDKTFHKRTQLRQHRKTHIADNQKVACEMCGMKFNRRGNLMQHIKRHSEDRKYVCRICKQEFTVLNAMLSHRRIHTQEDIKKRIIEGENKEEHGNVYTCEICGKVLFKKSSFAYHMRAHKGQMELEDEKLKCNLCGKLLASRASLNYHTKSQHSNERPWRCQFCAEGFMLKELLLTHERIHTGEKPYICSVCSKAFRAPNNLTQHMLMHTENRNYQCPYCNKRFHRKGTLNVHIRTHTGERPFICDLCGRPFTQKNDMLKHQRTHGLQPQYSCDVCSLSFNFKKDLTKHKLLNHREDLDTDVVPVIFTSDGANNVFGNITHIITEDGKKILLSTVQSFEDNGEVQ